MNARPVRTHVREAPSTISSQQPDDVRQKDNFLSLLN